MNNGNNMAWKLYKWTTLLSIFALVVLGVAQVYVRWKINQNFTFLGDAGFPSLCALVLGELLGLAYLMKGRE